MEASTLQAPVALQRFSAPAALLRVRSDEQLVAAFRAGSEDAFRAIHDRYRARLLSYTRQMLGASRHDAEDVLQDVFVRVYRALRADDRPVSLRAWLYRIAHNRCIDRIRRPEPVEADVFEMSRTPGSDPSDVLERREDLRRLVNDVRRLPDQQRSALLMREMQGMTYDELAQALDVTVPAVKSLLVRARTGLAESAEARDTACSSVRHDLTLAVDRGVRASGLARRHMRDCAGCREYRDDLRSVRKRFAALVPVGPLGALWQAIGLGGGAAGTGTAASLGGAGGAGALVTATKVAIVCAAAAVTAGGALEVVHPVSAPSRHRAAVLAAPQPAAPPAPPAATLAAPVSVSAPAPVWTPARHIMQPVHHRAHSKATAPISGAVSLRMGAMITASVGTSAVSGGTGSASDTTPATAPLPATGTTGATGAVPATGTTGATGASTDPSTPSGTATTSPTAATPSQTATAPTGSSSAGTAAGSTSTASPAGTSPSSGTGTTAATSDGSGADTGAAGASTTGSATAATSG